MSKVAKEYARALFGACEGSKSEVLSFLQSLKSSLQGYTPFMETYKSGVLSSTQLKGIFENLVEKSGVSHPTLKNFFYLLVDKRRVMEVIEIADEFQAAMDEEAGVLRGVVRSATPISEIKLKELEAKFSTRLDKNVVLKAIEDPKVVAGLKIEVGAYTFDDTFETHIKNIKENLNRSWS